MRFLIPLIFGIAGVAVLVGLGLWQLDRLHWKRGVLAEIDSRIAADPVALPATPDPERDRYLPVAVSGTILPQTLRVLVSRKQVGAGYRLISALDTGAGRLLLDRGFIRIDAPLPEVPQGEVQVIGTLHWPDDRNASTPANDTAANVWFARDLDQMAQALGAAPVLVVARDLSPAEQGVSPLPVDTSAIPNDHLEYAITWFSLAAIWAAMTAFFLWRLRARPTGG